MGEEGHMGKVRARVRRGLGELREPARLVSVKAGVGARVKVWVRRGAWERLGRGLGAG